MLTSKKVSESIRLGSILMFSGGFLDAYSYLVRGQVFATAETGNIALMGISLARGDLAMAGRYLIPVAAYAAGIFLTEWIRMRVGENGTVHWKEGILWLELLVMVLVGFMPQKWNSLVNCLIGFSCAMQVEAFRKMKGSAYASTMCIGNLRSATEMLYRYRHTKEKGCLEKCLRYYGVILVFGIGAALGSFMTSLFEERTIWISCGFLFVCFCIMFIKEDIEGERGLD